MTVTIPMIEGSQIILGFLGAVGLIMVIKWLIGIIF